jgi:hypothetical protein
MNSAGLCNTANVAWSATSNTGGAHVANPGDGADAHGLRGRPAVRVTRVTLQAPVSLNRVGCLAGAAGGAVTAQATDPAECAPRWLGSGEMFQGTQKSLTISSGPHAVHWGVAVCGGGVLRVTDMYSCMNGNGVYLPRSSGCFCQVPELIQRT